MRTSLLGLVLVATACDPVLFSAELDAPEVCISGYRVAFPPLGAGGESENTMSSGDIGLPDSDDFDLDVSVLSIGITPSGGVDDLGFIDALSVRAASADPAGQLPEVMLVQMDHASLTSEGSLYGEPESPVDIADQLRTGDILFKTNVAGTLPDVAWESNMELCVHAAARFRQPI